MNYHMLSQYTIIQTSDKHGFSRTHNIILFDERNNSRKINII